MHIADCASVYSKQPGGGRLGISWSMCSAFYYKRPLVASGHIFVSVTKTTLGLYDSLSMPSEYRTKHRDNLIGYPFFVPE